MGNAPAQQYPHAIRRGFIPLLLVSSAALLSACGGGGGGGSSAGVPATPQSVTGPYTVVETSQGTVSTATHKVRVVDLRTGSEARSYDIVGADIGDRHRSGDWHIISQHAQDADGLGYSNTGSSQLAVIQSGKVKLLDLSGSTLGTERQISNLGDGSNFGMACAILQRDAVLSADGRHAWLRVATSGMGTCALPTGTTNVLVSTDMAANDAPVASGTPSGTSATKDIVLVMRDTAGASQGLLVIERGASSNTLRVYSNDLKNTVASAPLPSVAATLVAARTLAASPSDARQALVQIGASLYLADWRSGGLNLGSPIATLTSNTTAASDAPVVTRDSATFYVADGNKVLAIGASGSPVSTATLESGRGTVVDAAATNSGIVVSQNNAAATSGFASTLWHISKAAFTQTPAKAAESTSTLPYRIDAVNGDNVVYSQQGDINRPLWRTLYRWSAPSTGTSIVQPAVATDVGLITHVRNPHVRVGVASVDRLLWCKPDNLAQGCTGALISYDVATNPLTPSSIGTVPAAGAAPSTELSDFNDAWSGRNMVFMLTGYAQDGSHADTLYMVNPSTAGSLQAVTLLP